MVVQSLWVVSSHARFGCFPGSPSSLQPAAIARSAACQSRDPSVLWGVGEGGIGERGGVLEGSGNLWGAGFF